MASIISNFPEVRRKILAIPHALDQTRYTRRGKLLGEAALDLVAENIRARTMGEQVTPLGDTFAPLKEPYASSPEKAGKPIGYLTGDMLDLEAIKGTQVITESRASMTYGRTEEEQ